MNPTAIYSKSGKGVQEASGKTSLLKRPDRAVLSAIDGRLTLADVAQKVGRSFDAGFQQLIVQLDKDGFVREVSAGTAPAAKPGAKAPAKPAATQAMDAASDLDFSSLVPARPASPPPAAKPAPAAPKPPPAAPRPPPAAPRPDAGAEARAKEQQAALNKAREEAEAKAQAERDRIKAETEAKMRAELEAKARADAGDKIKAEAESRAKGDAEADAKVKAAREAAVRAAAEAKAKADAERKAREETERRLEQERKAREETERRLEQERKAREEAERKAREEAERARKELEEERRKLEEERKREEQERAARRKREEEEEQARRKKREEEEQRAEAERAARRKQREEEEERQAEEERAARRKQREEEPEEEPKAEAKPKAEPKAAGGLDSLLADLDSFTQRDEDERKAGEEAARKAKAEAERRAQEEAERQEREASERKTKESERSRKDDEKRRRKEEEERLAREQEKEQARLREEEERRKREADERARKAKEDEALTRQATAGATAPVGEGTDQVRRRMVGKRAPASASATATARTEHFEAPARPRKSGSWGKPVAITLILLLAAAIGAAHVMPISTEDYERAASEALGRPVKIGSARLSLMTGLQLHFKDVKIGDGVMIASVAGSPELAALRGEKKIFSRIDLEGVKLPQEALGEVLFAKVKGDNFAVGRIVLKQLELAGPVPLPKPLEADLAFGPDGALRSVTLRGPDTLLARLAPKGAAIEFEMTANGFPLPVVPEVTLSDFGMKGTASQRGMSIGEWGGKLFGGTISGTANVRWGRTWNVEGLITARSINAAVFAPALLSEGKAEGSGKFSMNGAEPSKLATAGRIEGSFTVSMGVLGSFDLARAIQTNGKAVNGRTQFSEMNGQGVYDHGAVALRNVTIGAGRLNAGASADITQGGALSGRIVADMKTASQTLRATLNLGGTVKEPQVRN